MRQVTAQEKYKAVNEGMMAEAEFIRQMKLAFPQYISPANGYNDTVQILKNYGMLTEIKKEQDDTSKYSDDSLRRSIDIELEAMGIKSEGEVAKEDIEKAKKKAIANLKKDPLHYYNLISGESSKVDKHDGYKETKRGKLEKDTFNDMKKATLKERKENLVEGTRALVGFLSGDRLTTTYNHYDGYPSNLGKGLEAHYNNDEAAKDVAMKGYITYMDPETGDIESTHNDAPGKVILPDDPEQRAREIAEEIDKFGADYGYVWDDESNQWITIKNTGIRSMIDQIMEKMAMVNVYSGEKMNEADPIPTEPGIPGQRASNHDRKMAMRNIIDFLTKSGHPDTGYKVSNDDAISFIKTHKDDIFNGDIDHSDINDVWSNYDEFESVNRDSVDEKKVNELEDTVDGRDIGGKIIEFADGNNVDLHVVYHRYETKEFYDIPVEKAIDITNKYIDQNDLTQANTGEKDYILMIDDGDASIDIKKADGKKWDSDEVIALAEKKGKDHDGDGDVDSDDYMAAKDKAIKKAMGKDVDEGYADYEPGTIAPKDLYYSDKHGKLVAMDDVDDKYHDRLELVYRKGDEIEGPMDEAAGDDEHMVHELIGDLFAPGNARSHLDFSVEVIAKALEDYKEDLTRQGVKDAMDLYDKLAADGTLDKEVEDGNGFISSKHVPKLKKAFELIGLYGKGINEGMTIVGHTPEERKKNAEEIVAKAKELGLEADIKYNNGEISSVEIGKSGLRSHPDLRDIQDRQFDDYDKNKPKDNKSSFKPKKLKKLKLGGKTYEIGDLDPNDDGRIMSIEKYPNGYFIQGGVYSNYGDGDEPKQGYGYAIDLKGKEMDEEDLEGMYELAVDRKGNPKIDSKPSRFKGRDKSRLRTIKELRGAGADIIEVIKAMAMEMDGDEIEAAMEVMEFIGEEFKIDFEFGRVGGGNYGRKQGNPYEGKLKEAVKAIITKSLEEEMINEAATQELARIADEYDSFDGLKPAVISLENIVTEIESFYDKTRQKIQKIYDDLGEVRNEEGLKVGAFITPAIENAFKKDLRPITKAQFHGGLKMPQIKRISQADVDRGYVQQEAPKQTVYSPVNEKKNKNEK